ncbi:MAG: Mfa1 fimbrilin C-terminal domain-containing protein [Muribaculaceae bacterium]|nr:Mfa1 fimbrilin C-terminal domain-containing protein [Muribaculaceae bacterium]
MRKNRYFVLASTMLALVAGGCSSDNFDLKDSQQVQVNEGDGFYMSIDVVMPSGSAGTRSETGNPDDGYSTSDGGVEVGTSGESTVSSALIVLAATDNLLKDVPEYGFIAAGEVSSNHLGGYEYTIGDGSKSQAYRALAQLNKASLEIFYETVRNPYDLETNPNVNHEVYVFVFCNPTNDLRNIAKNTKFGETSWVNSTCNVFTGNVIPGGETPDNTTIWSQGTFLMNNATLAIRSLPRTLEDWDEFDSSDTPFHLSDNNRGVSVDNSKNPTPVDRVHSGGAVWMERSVARFDFKDGSGNNNTYNVLYNYVNGQPDTDQPIVDIQLQRMALVNMSNKFYYLRRVSSNGLLTGPNDFNGLCQAEEPWAASNGVYTTIGNYVVGPYYDEFSKATTITAENYGTTAYKCFNYPLFQENGTLDTDNMTGNDAQWDAWVINDVLKDNTDKSNIDQTGQYHIWRYLTENVIPGTDGADGNQNFMNQKNAISTGVVFKGQMLGNTSALDIVGAGWEKGMIPEMVKCLNGEEFSLRPSSTEAPIHRAINGNPHDDPILYYFEGKMYMTWNHIRQAAIQAAVRPSGDSWEINRSNSLFRAVFGPFDGSDAEGVIPPGQYYLSGEAGPTQEMTEIVDPMWAALNEAEPGSAEQRYQLSADYAWAQWSADKQLEGNLYEAMCKEIKQAGINMYLSSRDNGKAGYYCYFYYWNRHNDNHRDGVMGPMEFDVVRNNVYKLSVDKIRYPGTLNPPTPDDDDEHSQVYLDVRVEVLPWVVRYNSINF